MASGSHPLSAWVVVAMSWRDRIAQFFGLRGGRTRAETVRPWRHADIDPIEELARIIGEAQERDAQEEGRLDDLARSAEPMPMRAARRPPRRVRRF